MKLNRNNSNYRYSSERRIPSRLSGEKKKENEMSSGDLNHPNKQTSVVPGTSIIKIKTEANSFEQLLSTGVSYVLFVVTFRLVLKSTVNFFKQITNEVLIKSHEFERERLGANISQYLKPNATLTSYEREIITSSFIDPNTITEVMEDVGGLESIKSALTEVAIINNNKRSTLLNICVRSALLSGPPGNGKNKYDNYYYFKLFQSYSVMLIL